MAIDAKLPPLLVRADADARQGAGHVMRSLALARAWSLQGGAVQFVTRRPVPALRRQIELAGARVRELDDACPTDIDLDRTRAAIGDLMSDDKAPPPWLILDGYHFTLAYQSAIRQTGCRLVVIDDNAQLARYDADIVINHGVGAPRLDYGAAGDAWLLLGTRYALLRAEFAPWRGFHRTVAKTAKNILLTCGGADGGNLTVKLLDAVVQLRTHDLDVQILAGPLNPHLDALHRRAAAMPNTLIHTDVTDTAPLMAWADIAIAAAGTTAWELAFMQTPALLLIAAQNQRDVAAGSAEFGAARALGQAEQLAVGEIAQALSQLIDDPEGRQRMAERGRVLVDGDGPARVLAAMAERQRFDRASDVTVRRAGTGDELLLWQWANDPQTRRNSFSSAAIRWDDHRAWCARKFAAAGCRLWIMELGDLPVAQIRYERIDSDLGGVAEISFSVAPGFRGMQLGSRLLTVTMSLAASELHVERFQGVALQSNEASQRLFLKAGFVAAEQRCIDGRLFTVFCCDYARVGGEPRVRVH